MPLDFARRLTGRKRSTSAQPAALSFAPTPRLQSPQAAVERMQRALAPGTRLAIVRLMSEDDR